MTFDKNAAGNVIVSPLIWYEAATAKELGCLLRLELALSLDQPQTPGTVVQIGLTPDQTEELAQVLLRMATSLRDPPNPSIH